MSILIGLKTAGAGESADGDEGLLRRNQVQLRNVKPLYRSLAMQYAFRFCLPHILRFKGRIASQIWLIPNPLDIGIFRDIQRHAKTASRADSRVMALRET